MALELVVFSIIAIAGLISFLVGAGYKISFVFLAGCLLLAMSGISIFAFDGLVISRELTSVADDGSFVYSDNVLSSSNVALSGLGILLVLIPLVSFFVIDFSGVKQRRSNVYHY